MDITKCIGMDVHKEATTIAVMLITSASRCVSYFTHVARCLGCGRALTLAVAVSMIRCSLHSLWLRDSVAHVGASGPLFGSVCHDWAVSSSLARRASFGTSADYGSALPSPKPTASRSFPLSPPSCPIAGATRRTS
jgi:hypothetical protein